MRKVLLSILLSFVFLVIAPRQAHAYKCELASWDPNTRNLQICVSGFPSGGDIAGTTLTYNCTSNSNYAPAPSLCRGVTNNTATFSGSAVGTNANGEIFSCLTATGINRAIGQMNVVASKNGQELCRVNDIFTKPPDWDPITEGLPWQKGTNDPLKSSLCGDKVSINSALGCIPALTGNVSDLMGFILKWAIGVGGGIAFLLILYAGFMIMTSSGDPQRLKAGQELLTAAISGIILLVLSLFLLRVVGVDILGIPGFST